MFYIVPLILQVNHSQCSRAWHETWEDSDDKEEEDLKDLLGQWYVDPDRDPIRWVSIVDLQLIEQWIKYTPSHTLKKYISYVQFTSDVWWYEPDQFCEQHETNKSNAA